MFGPGAAPPSRFPTSPHALPVGTRIGEFEVHRLIGEGGFGIVYLCYDQALDRHVALKEYMPSSLATRQNETLAIVVKSKNHSETFEAGLKSFINEARLLAQFDHPSLLKVYRFWQANGTAYMTMPYYEGPTLKQALSALSGPPDESLLRSWLLPMLDALEEIHRANCYHRDIAPDNILLTASGPLLLDFGAARRVIGDMTQALTVVLKPGFAPIEQYGDAATLSQGAWTDLYALASVVYFAITGRPPMSAVDRVMDDRLEPLSHRVAGRYSHALLAAVDTALSVRPQDRPQSVADFRAMLSARPHEQTADLRLWSDDDVPTALDADTVPGALLDSSHNEPRTIPTGRKTNDDQAHTPFVPRPPAVSAGSGAGLAPLSGSAGVPQPGHKVGRPSPLPAQPSLAERTAMPSLLAPFPSIHGAAQPQAAKEQAPQTDSHKANKGPNLQWLLWLSLTAFVMVAAVVVWTFTRVDGDPETQANTTRLLAPEAPTKASVASVPMASPPPSPPTAANPVNPGAVDQRAAPHSKIASTQTQPAPERAKGDEPNTARNTLPDPPPIRLGGPPAQRTQGDAPAWVLTPSPAPMATGPDTGLRSVARCAEIRQRAGREDLTNEERQFLRTQCQ